MNNRSSIPGARILIVDDKEENIYYLQSLFEAHKYIVETAQNGAEALDLARQSNPAIVVSDLLMPVMDGYSLLRKWKTDEVLKSIPFVVYTATYTEPEDERLALDLGADAFILKPAEPSVLLAQVQKLLEEAPKPLRSPEVADEKEMLKAYSQTLIRKLEEKTLALEEANRSLKADLQARQAIEASLRESEMRFRQLAEYINEVFYITTPDNSTMLYVSPAYEKIWGLSCESLILHPSTWKAAIHPEDAERVLQAVEKRATTGKYDLEYRIIHSDGSMRWIHDRAFAVTDDSGNIYRFVGTAADITERRKLEHQFFQSQRMESIGTLAGGIAHDLNNVLSPILMSIDMLKERLKDEEGISILETTESCAIRGAQLVKQVLGFARGIEGERIPVNPAHIIKDLIKVVKDTFPKCIETRLSIPSDLWTITGDPTQLNQVFLNLLVNARDAMPDGGVITIGMKNREIEETYASLNPDARAGSFVLVEIVDTGTGIPIDVRDRIFEPFFTTKEFGHGTGLGLSTSLTIIKSHKGFLDVYSEPGRGTKFAIYLPAEAAHEPVIETGSKEQRFPKGSNELVLVVDDEQAIRQIVRASLERFGYRVVTAFNGLDAASIYASRCDEIDVVLTDLAMPVMDGKALIAELRKINPSVRIIGASGLESNTRPSEAALHGFDDFIAKPYTTETILGALSRVLSSVNRSVSGNISASIIQAQ